MAQGTGYINGNDLLIEVAEIPTGSGTATYKAIGHCTTHSTTFSSETKERAVKPAASVSTLGQGLYKEKTVVGLSASIKADGLRFYNDTEEGIGGLLTKWSAGKAIYVKAFLRTNDTAPYLSGSFVIASIEESAGAGDDATYSVSLESTGTLTIDGTKVDGVTQ